VFVASREASTTEAERVDVNDSELANLLSQEEAQVSRRRMKPEKGSRCGTSSPSSLVWLTAVVTQNNAQDK
jgi:hypothetical protein